MRRIEPSDLIPGAPLPCDLYGAEAAGAPLLLRKGQCLPAPAQLAVLLRAGLFADAAAPPSVLRLLNEIELRLEALLAGLPHDSGAEHALRALAGALHDALAQDADIALACLFLNQIRGPYAVRHSVETALLAALLARALGMPAPDVLIVTGAALSMNVGMLSQHEHFQRHGAALTPREAELVRRHPADGARLLRCAGIDNEEWLSCVMLHHARGDGDGYPAGAPIPYNARLIGLADRYCARVSARNYRRSLPPDQALRTLRDEAGDAADTALADQLARQIGAYPPGCLVRLCNGETGVVTRRAAPILVHALRDPAGLPYPADTAPFAALRDTGAPGLAIAAALHEDQAGVRFGMRQVWGERACL